MTIISSLRHSLPDRPLPLAAIYAAVSLFCTRIPLLNYLGYEFSALCALLASFVAGLATTAYARRALSGSDVVGSAAGEHGRKIVAASLRGHLILLLIPLAIITANALFVKNCSFLEGMAFYLLLPVVSVIFCVSLGFFCAVHYKHPRGVFLAVVGASLLYGLALGYYTPAVFSYNVFYGYFPGVTYDEVLEISWSLVLYRGLTLVLAAALVWMGLLILSSSRPGDSTLGKGRMLLKTMVHPPHRLPMLVLLVVLLLPVLLRDRLGFESHSGFIQQTLGKTYRTSHVVIYYDGASFSEDEIAWVGAEHEFQRSRILQMLRVPFAEQIESYIYPSPDAKRRLIGAGETNIAKPWSRQIHLSRQTLEGTLAHELVHVLAGPSGLPVINANLSTGLVEGLAMAIDEHWGNRTLHQYAAALHRFGSPPDVAALMPLRGFAVQSSSMSYVLTGSFCRFLIDRYGVRRMLQLYGGGGYERVYGRAVKNLADEWRRFLERIPLAEQSPDLIDAMFRRPPITQQVCARVIARRNAEAAKRFEERDYTSSAQLYARSHAETGGYNALAGYLASSLRMQNYGALIAALDSVVKRSAHPAQYLPVSLLIGDALWGAGEAGRAAELYGWIARTDVSDRLTEAAKLRMFCLSDSSRCQSYRSYFLSDADDTTRLALLDSLDWQDPGSWISLYLRTRVLQRLQRFDASLPVADSFVLAGTDSLLEAFRLRMVGHGLFRLKRFKEAEVAFWNSLNFHHTDNAVHEVYQLVDKCEWMSRYVFP